MKQKKSKISALKIKPSKEDWANIRRYQKVPTETKLKWLDDIREFLFEVWRNNPQVLKSKLRLQRLTKR